jgi:hypothetical protein
MQLFLRDFPPVKDVCRDDFPPRDVRYRSQVRRWTDPIRTNDELVGRCAKHAVRSDGQNLNEDLDPVWNVHESDLVGVAYELRDELVPAARTVAD